MLGLMLLTLYLESEEFGTVLLWGFLFCYFVMCSLYWVFLVVVELCIEVDNVFLCSAVDQYLKWRIPSPSIKPLTASSPARRSRISGPFRHQDSVTVLPLPLKADCGRLKLLPKFPHFLFFNLPKWTNLLLSWNQQTLTSIR